MVAEKDAKEAVDETNDHSARKGKTSIFSRFWKGLFRLYDDDFEKRLRYISKEEATILARMKKRSTRWRKTARNLIVSFVLLELIISSSNCFCDWICCDDDTNSDVGVEIEGASSFAYLCVACIAWVLYTGIHSLTGICERRDQRSLERLRDERQAKIDELKDRTNYYNTQQLIQKYDPDPAAKAAAASVLASKLGADSGLHWYVDESHLNQHDTGKSGDVEFMQSGGLRRRAPSEARSPGSTGVQDGGFQYAGSEVSEFSMAGELVVDHQSRVAMSPHDAGWMARLAALLVGEDPTQSYALICGNCHMHNGLARKENFLVFTYYCPHCHALNKPRNADESSTRTNSPNMRSLMTHHHALYKGENSSGTNTPDTKSSPTNHHHVNKPTKSGEICSDINIPNMKSSPTNRHRVNKLKKSGENHPDITTVVTADLVKESSESMSENLDVDEKKNVVAEDPDNH